MKVRVASIGASTKAGYSRICLENGELFISKNELVKELGLKSGAEVEIDRTAPDHFYSYNGVILYTDDSCSLGL